MIMSHHFYDHDDELSRISEKFQISSKIMDKYLSEDESQRYLSIMLEEFSKYLGNKLMSGVVLGAGRGSLSVCLGMKGIHIDSVEPYDPYYEITKWKYKRDSIQGSVIHQTAEAYDDVSEEYDFAVMMDVIEHVVNPLKCLKNIHKSLKPGAWLYLTVPNRFHIYDPHFKLPFICWMPLNWADKLLSIVGRNKVDGANGLQRLNTMHYFTFGDFRSLALDAGFEVIDARSLQAKFPARFLIKKNLFFSLAVILTNLKLSWMTKYVSRAFFGHRFLLIKN